MEHEIKFWLKFVIWAFKRLREEHRIFWISVLLNLSIRSDKWVIWACFISFENISDVKRAYMDLELSKELFYTF